MLRWISKPKPCHMNTHHTPPTWIVPSWQLGFIALTPYHQPKTTENMIHQNMLHTANWTLENWQYHKPSSRWSTVSSVMVLTGGGGTMVALLSYPMEANKCWTCLLTLIILTQFFQSLSLRLATALSIVSNNIFHPVIPGTHVIPKIKWGHMPPPPNTIFRNEVSYPSGTH